MGELARRRSDTQSRIERLRHELAVAEELVRGKACVYATGSFGRREAGEHSDLDLFIVGKTDDVSGASTAERKLLRPLDEICVKADLIYATRALGIPDFDGDGRYLAHYSVRQLTKTLGTPEDDVTNTFTARLLLLLESFPLLDAAVYREVMDDVIAAYWRDYEDHKTNFMPAFLANDILRMWRTFCVNYEARTQREPESKKAKGKIKNYKLKHSRLLTCYSALLCFLAVYNRVGSVSPEDAKEAIFLSPTQRLEWLLGREDLAAAHDPLSKLSDQYERFLEKTNVKEEGLQEAFMAKETSRQYMREASEFGDTMFEALTRIGKGSSFHRMLVV